MTEGIAKSACDLAWGLWKELGVPGVVRIPRSPVVDLEWLVVHTPFLSSQDARLDELSFGWCVHNHSLISTRRLRAITKRVAKDVSEPFWAWSAELRSLARVNWVEAHEATPSSRHVRRLVPDLSRPSLVSLRARSVFGVGARADIVCAMLERDGEWLRASDLVEQGYSKKAVAAVLTDLDRAGLLSSTKKANADVFISASTPVLADLLRAHGTSWMAWSHVFQVITIIIRLERELMKPETVRLVAADQARRSLLPAVAALGWPEPPQTAAVPIGFESMLLWGSKCIETLLGHA
ncbi:MAG: hypothetical protein HN348_23715 [Proteobacteria bacterium]|nr:hypothetical protein [Pseudomonadota bacterium]